MSKRPRSIAFYVYGGSILLHAGLAVGTILMPKPKRVETVAIELAEAKKKKDPPKPPPVPPAPPAEDKPKAKPAAQAQHAQAKVAPEAKPAEAPPPPMNVGADGFADLGMSLGNADGPGVAVAGPVAATDRPKNGGGQAAPTATAHKVQALQATQAETCTDPPVRPKRKIPVAPKYTMQARQAEIEGVVRVEVTVDEGGHVLSARVIAGLGYGLDEAALAAAKATVFEPATRCGKPVIGTTILPFRFEQT